MRVSNKWSWYKFGKCCYSSPFLERCMIHLHVKGSDKYCISEIALTAESFFFHLLCTTMNSMGIHRQPILGARWLFYFLPGPQICHKVKLHFESELKIAVQQEQPHNKVSENLKRIPGWATKSAIFYSMLLSQTFSPELWMHYLDIYFLWPNN